MKSLYLDNGYLNFEKIRSYDTYLTIIMGGRGIGKTYGLLQDELKKNRFFLFFRRTDTILKSIMNPVLDPMAPVCKDMGMSDIVLETLPQTQGYLHGWYHGDFDEKTERLKGRGDPLGLCAGLSTFGNLRGFGGDMIQDIIFDEFALYPGDIPFSDSEPFALWNACETIGRNRKLQGKPPLRVYLLSNAVDLANDYFLDLGCCDTCDKMLRAGEDVYVNRERNYTIIFPHDSPISKEKAKDELYQVTKGTRFYKMSIENVFSAERLRASYKSINLQTYTPLVSVGELTIYKERDTEKYYGCLHRMGRCPSFDFSKIGVRAFCSQYSDLRQAYFYGLITFETYTSEALFQKAFHLI